jgi:hypothetical protein
VEELPKLPDQFAGHEGHEDLAPAVSSLLDRKQWNLCHIYPPLPLNHPRLYLFPSRFPSFFTAPESDDIFFFFLKADFCANLDALTYDRRRLFICRVICLSSIS